MSRLPPSFPLRFVYVACALFASRAVDGSPLFQSTGSVRMFWISCDSFAVESSISGVLSTIFVRACDLSVPCHRSARGGEKVCWSFARSFFFFFAQDRVVTVVLARIERFESISKRREKERKPTTILVSLGE